MNDLTIPYAIACGLFLFNFIASVAMTHVVVTKLARMKDSLYYWIFFALALEGAIALASFYPLIDPNEKISGILVSTWLNAAYAAAVANMYAWVIVFHLSSDRWNQK